MGKKSFFAFKRSRRQSKKKAGPSLPHPLPPPPPLRAISPPEAGENGGAVPVVKGKKKAGGARLWMRFDRFGNPELVECDKNAIIKRVALPARDLGIRSW
ncbi:unnamed protein product [Linum trigynum]|uniref:Uncharacterized protein n=1 Tax=Linum trigynum TaxID=586398 RepID=A0AAV2EHV2_9ROSI